MNKIKFLSIIALLCLSAGFTSCLSDDDDGPSAEIYQAILTFVREADGKVYFDYQASESGTPISYWTEGTMSKEIKAGTRLLVTYNLLGNHQWNENGEIRVRAITLVHEVTPVTAAVELPARLNPINLSGPFYRTAGWINFQAKLPAVKDRKFTATVDQSSLSGDIPMIYLNTEIPADEPEGADGTYTVSVNIEALWSNTAYRGVTFVVNDEKDPTKTEYTFLKK